MQSWLIFAACLTMMVALWWRQDRRYRQWRASLQRQYDEQARREQQELHAQFQVRQQALFNGMIEGVLLLDEQGRVQMVNESLRKFFGVANDIHGQTIMEAFRWHELAALAARLPGKKTLPEPGWKFIASPAVPCRSTPPSSTATQGPRRANCSFSTMSPA